MALAQSIAPGTVFGGDYEVERLLAAGGMGAVYVARQRSTQKLRALKTMLPQFVSDPALRARFTREATIGAHIESDHVVEALAAGIDDATGVPWLAMELLAGADLAHAVAQRGRLQPSEVLELAKQLGHALGAAHRAGVVHRDLKPENIYLSTARREGVPFTVKVLDFGIARILDGVSARATTSIIGSPLWMAPEQTDVSTEVTPSTDVWAVALIMFWVLTGKHYWRTPNSPDASLPAMLRELVVDPLAPASQRAAALGVGPRLPPGFDAWFARCVARDQSARFRDAGEAFPPLTALLAAVSTPMWQSQVPAGGPAMPATVAMPRFEVATRAPQVTGLPGAAPAVLPLGPTGVSTYAGVSVHAAPTLHSQAAPARSTRLKVLAVGVAIGVLAGIGGLAVALRGPSSEPVAQLADLAHVAPIAQAPAAPKAPSTTAAPLPPEPVNVVAADAGAQRGASPSRGSRSRTLSPRVRGPLRLPMLPLSQGGQAPSTAPQPSYAPTPSPAPQPSPHPTHAPSAEPALCAIEAGPLWNNGHAQGECPGVCQRAGAQRYTGQWWTTRRNEMSVCQCAFPAGRACR